MHQSAENAVVGEAPGMPVVTALALGALVSLADIGNVEPEEIAALTIEMPTLPTAAG